MNQYVLFDLCNTIAWGGVSHTRANFIELQMMDTYNPKRLILCKESDPSYNCFQNIRLQRVTKTNHCAFMRQLPSMFISRGVH